MSSFNSRTGDPDFPLGSASTFGQSLPIASETTGTGEQQSKQSLVRRSMTRRSMTRRSIARRSRARRWAPWVAGVVSLLLVLTTLWIGYRVRESMRAVNRMSIETIRNANVAVMEIWLDGRTADAAACVADETIQDAARSILENAIDVGVSGEKISASQRAKLRADAMQQLSTIRFDQNDFIGWCLLDPSGKVVASDQEVSIGGKLPIANDVRDRIDLSLSTVTRPFTCPIAVADSGRFAQPGHPLMLAICPVVRGVSSLGGFALLIDPMDRFCKLLQTAQIGKSCETIAMDGEGVFITRSRFDSQFLSNGLIEAESGGSVLHLHARVPTAGKLVTRFDPSLPLTVAADQATRGATGSNLSGYQDYRGQRVIGTWCWVPQYNFAVVTKIDYDEAYGPMRILRNSFALLFTVVLLTSLGLFALAAVVRRFAVAPSPVRRLGQYELKDTLDIGGTGKVYLARHESLQRDVAVKVLEYDAVNPHSFSRFEREVRLTAKLRHPNTVEIYDFGRTEEGTFFYVMQYVQGVSLARLIQRDGRQDSRRVIHILRQVCWSLSEAHEKGMVHRDIKPANILLSSQAGVYDLVKVLDFGLVKDLAHESAELTQFASITGTPSYMSPESVRDASMVDHRSDIYSLGAVGYHLLCGLAVFTGEHAADICAKQLHETPLPPGQRLGAESCVSDADTPLFPNDLSELLMTCLQKNPEQRPQTMSEFAERLSRCLGASDWTMADARSWWQAAAEKGMESPRDAAGDFADNSSQTID